MCRLFPASPSLSLPHTHTRAIVKCVTNNANRNIDKHVLGFMFWGQRGSVERVSRLFLLFNGSQQLP